MSDAPPPPPSTMACLHPFLPISTLAITGNGAAPDTRSFTAAAARPFSGYVCHRISLRVQTRFSRSATMSIKKGVVLLDFWMSAFGQRVRIALAEKGVDYEYSEQSLLEKSSVLLEANPVHKKIPVLVHDGKPVCESLIIVEYIDEVWSDKAPLLPKDPYERAKARFWSDYIDKRIYDCGTRIWKLKGEGQEAAKKEMIEILSTLQSELGEKTYFGGDAFGFVDVALVPFTSWFHAWSTLGSFSIEKEVPKLVAWGKKCMERESVAKTLPDPVKVYEFVLILKEKSGI